MSSPSGEFPPEQGAHQAPTASSNVMPSNFLSTHEQTPWMASQQGHSLVTGSHPAPEPAEIPAIQALNWRLSNRERRSPPGTSVGYSSSPSVVPTALATGHLSEDSSAFNYRPGQSQLYQPEVDPDVESLPEIMPEETHGDLLHMPNQNPRSMLFSDLQSPVQQEAGDRNRHPQQRLDPRPQHPAAAQLHPPQAYDRPRLPTNTPSQASRRRYDDGLHPPTAQGPEGRSGRSRSQVVPVGDTAPHDWAMSRPTPPPRMSRATPAGHSDSEIESPLAVVEKARPEDDRGGMSRRAKGETDKDNPPARNSHRSTGLYFNSYEEAKRMHYELDWSLPKDDSTVPKTHEQQRFWIKKLVAAFKNRVDIKDKMSGPVLKARWLAERSTGIYCDYYGADNIERVCWDILETILRMYNEGLAWVPVFDRETWSKAYRESDFTFQQRLNILIKLFKRFKNRCDKMMKGENRFGTLLAPEEALKTAENNRNANDERHKMLHKGRAVYLKEEAQKGKGVGRNRGKRGYMKRKSRGDRVSASPVSTETQSEVSGPPGIHQPQMVSQPPEEGHVTVMSMAQPGAFPYSSDKQRLPVQPQFDANASYDFGHGAEFQENRGQNLNLLYNYDDQTSDYPHQPAEDTSQYDYPVCGSSGGETSHYGYQPSSSSAGDNTGAYRQMPQSHDYQMGGMPGPSNSFTGEDAMNLLADKLGYPFNHGSLAQVQSPAQTGSFPMQAPSPAPSNARPYKRGPKIESPDSDKRDANTNKRRRGGN